MPPDRAAAPEGAIKVDAQDVTPLLRRAVLRKDMEGDPGVIDQDIDLLEVVNRLGGHGLHAGVILDIGFDGDGLPP